MKRKEDEEAIREVDRAKRAKLLQPEWSFTSAPGVDEQDSQMRVNTEADGRNLGIAEFIRENENDIYTLFPGRKSFGGFNVKVEKYCQTMVDDRRLDQLAENTISDEEMIRRYEQMRGSKRKGESNTTTKREREREMTGRKKGTKG